MFVTRLISALRGSRKAPKNIIEDKKHEKKTVVFLVFHSDVLAFIFLVLARLLQFYVKAEPRPRLLVP